MTNLINFESSIRIRYVRISPFKLRRVLNIIRGRNYIYALLVLTYMPYKSCKIILNAINSAVSNLKMRSNVLNSKIFIAEARADCGNFLKRFRSHAQGRIFPIKKRVSHIIIV
uniref:50S ribosomal protein L22, chloroplastic n=1 Tax=Trachelomonas grandis TaxID=215769 RepID=A0A385UK63_9EUGL|nr:ribosomal protein L22 [Trachelomonas grandis]